MKALCLLGLLSLVLFLQSGAVVGQELGPQEPHFKEGEHNPKYVHTVEEAQNEKLEEESKISCVIELPEVRTFLRQEAKNFENLQVKYTYGDPRVKCFDNNGNQLGEQVTVSSFSKNKLIEFFKEKGLKYKS